MKVTSIISTVLLFGASFAMETDELPAVVASATEAKPLKAGVEAPNAKLVNLDGDETLLKDVLKGKKTVLIFYRGGWCPYCNTYLQELAQMEAEIRNKGFQIIAVSPDSPSELKKTMDKVEPSYTILSDSSAEAMRRFGVAFRLDDETFTMYRDRFGIDLEASSGQQHHILPVPSVFVIDASGKITFSHSNPDYKVRLSGEELIKAIEKS